MPEVHIFGVITTYKEINQPVVVVVKPNGGVCIYPRRQVGLRSHISAVSATLCVEQCRATPFVDKEIVIAIVVIIAPDGAHRHPSSDLIDIRDPNINSHIFEGAVTQVSIKTVLASFAAVG